MTISLIRLKDSFILLANFTRIHIDMEAVCGALDRSHRSFNLLVLLKTRNRFPRRVLPLIRLATPIQCRGCCEFHSFPSGSRSPRSLAVYMLAISNQCTIHQRDCNHCNHSNQLRERFEPLGLVDKQVVAFKCFSSKSTMTEPLSRIVVKIMAALLVSRLLNLALHALV